MRTLVNHNNHPVLVARRRWHQEAIRFMWIVNDEWQVRNKSFLALDSTQMAILARKVGG